MKKSAGNVLAVLGLVAGVVASGVLVCKYGLGEAAF
jgi:hypothetical protein